MLEFFLLMLLIKGVKNNAVSRGRKPGGFIALAIVLWIVLELTGLFIGIGLGMEQASYLLAAGGAGLSALISYNVAKHCKEGDYVAPNELTIRQFTEYYEPLPAEQPVTITRDKAFAGAGVKYEISLNGKLVGNIANGDTLHGFTDQRQNVLTARLNGGDEFPPFVFQVADGCPADIHFVSGRFIPERSTGIVAYGQAVMINPQLAKARYVPVADTQQVAPLYAPAQGVPAYGTPVASGYADPNKPMVPVYSNPGQPAASPYAAPGQQAASSNVGIPVAAPGSNVGIPVAAPVAAAAAAPAGGYCESCGSPLPANAKFCGKCGARIEQ